MSRSAVHRRAIRSVLLRVGVVAGAAIVLAACAPSSSPGGTTTSTGATSTGTSTVAPTPGTASGGPASSGSSVLACDSSSLAGEVDLSAASGAAGSTYYPVDLTNTSARTCTLYGYPGVSFVTGPSGTQVGDAARRNPVTAASTVTLDPGQVAHAALQVADAGNYDQAQCVPVTVHYLRVYPPGQTTALVIPFTTQACSATLPASIGSQLSITVMQPGAN